MIAMMEYADYATDDNIDVPTHARLFSVVQQLLQRRFINTDFPGRDGRK